MCNLVMAVELKGVKRGAENTTLQNIRNLMDSTKWSAQQAMDALKIPKSDQARYAAKLDSDK